MRKNSVKRAIVLVSLMLIATLVGIIFSLNRLINQQMDVEEVKPTVVEEKKVEINHYQSKLFVAGDALLHGAVYTDAKKADGTFDFASMVETLRPITNNHDLNYYNQETILGGTQLGLSTYPRFNSPQEFGDTMIDLGFNLVSLANNHTMDRNEEGVLASLAYWKDKPVLTAGSYSSFEERNSVKIKEMNGITFGFLSYTYGTNGLLVPSGKEYLCNVYTEEMISQDVQRVREQVDVLLVAMHWGVEYTHEPTKEQRHYAQLLADLGVDVIIGAHPHVVQPIEMIDDTIVFYSLGNLISAQDGTLKRIGLLGSVTIEKTVIDGVSSIELLPPKADLIYTDYKKGYKQFKLYTFDELNDEILPNYQAIYEQYGNVVVKNFPGMSLSMLK